MLSHARWIHRAVVAGSLVLAAGFGAMAIGATVIVGWWWLLPLAAMAHSWAVHIGHHALLHATGGGARGWWVGLLATPLLGLPFDGYRLHHRNHHQHDNGIDDWSRTWEGEPTAPRPRNLWAYALGWPRDLRAARTRLRAGADAGMPAWVPGRIRVQQALLLLVLLALAWWQPLAAVVYVAWIYLGWAFVAIHNYGQHPPFPGAVISLHQPWYNRLTGANGLHVEHHQQPEVPLALLVPQSGVLTTRRCHAFGPGRVPC